MSVLGRSRHALVVVAATFSLAALTGCGDEPAPSSPEAAGEAVTVGPVLEVRADDGSWKTRNAQRREFGQELLCIAVEGKQPEGYGSVCRETARILTELVPTAAALTKDAKGTGSLDLVELPGTDPAKKRVFAIGLVHGAVERVVIDDQGKQQAAKLGTTPLDVEVDERLKREAAGDLAALPPFAPLAPYAAELPSRASIKGLKSQPAVYNRSTKTLTFTTR